MAELGAGPLALARAHRANTARILIQNTTLTQSKIAFAAGFSSIRQFNDTIREIFACTPTALRTRCSNKTKTLIGATTINLKLPFRTPLNARWLEWFLASHIAPGIEIWNKKERLYRRSLRLPHGYGLIGATISTTCAIVNLTLSDLRDLSSAISRIRHLLDLDADPVAIDTALAKDPILHPQITQNPGLRVPGNVDGHELLLRTMIGQQISLSAACTRTGQLVKAIGEPIIDPHGELTHLFPTAATIASRRRSAHWTSSPHPRHQNTSPIIS